MNKMKLFEKFRIKNKPIKEVIQKPNSNKEENTKNEPKPIEEKEVIAEYKETIYTENSGSKKSNEDFSTFNYQSQRVWRDVNSIEKNIDNIEKRDRQSVEIDEKVDEIIKKKKKHNH